MPIEIFMPALSPTMEQGNLAKWLIKPGDAIAPGDVIAEIETDKATMEVEAVDEGTVGKILVDEGTEDIPVGQVIALLLAEGEDESSLEGAAQSSAPPPPPPAASDSAPAKTEAAPAKADHKPEAKAVPAPSQNGKRVKASPLARRLAQESGIDLAGLQGSGPRGRIVKRDLEGAKPGKAAAAKPEAAPSLPIDAPYEEIKLPGMRKVIAKRMTEAKTTVPHFYLSVDIELDELLAARKALNAKLEGGDVKLSVNDFIIRASALALKRVPEANAQYAGDTIYRYSRADISVAVAIPGGLITPVIRGACGKGLAEISTEMKALAAKARDGKLMPEDYQGGTFSISNLGMFGIKAFDAVINPPQGAILAVGAGEQRPVVKNGQLAVATVMTCTLSVDHRVLDGAIGANFLKELKGYLENPVTMLL
ncbi:MAG: pyruvate dehydrogenase complex dihydrolipoamide acetyltransferase [Sphingomonadales bacterium]